ncbi:Glycosyltransferase [Halapricum desulfuricans]|uniref:Glycosyltransferase n=2 Tax=Halapricum desulfuricans TaxID=2841257 RepID=A0A897N1Y4_9EURY|nr:Glycosyltransferase [Halapricum desulfuricans]
MGHYHYAQNLLGGLGGVEDLTVDTFYIDEDEAAEFPGSDSMRPLATTTRRTRSLNILATLFYHVHFLAYLLVSRPDVVHFNTVFRNQYHTYGLTLLGKLTGIRVVRTVHEVTAERLRDVSRAERRTAYLHLRTCDHLIVHSEDVRSDLQSSGVETATTVLPHGNYLFFREHLDPDVDPPLPIDTGPVVLFFGPKYHKGIDIFADAVTQVDASFTTWIVGAIADDATEYVQRIESQPRTYVDRGYIPDEAISDYFHHADVVVLPYRSGTTSGAVHLARAFETAVVTSPLTYFTDVIEHRVDGYVLSENTPIALADALGEIVSSSNLMRRLAETGLETERSSRFDWRRFAKETARIYKVNGDSDADK